jgi:tetratricopeptide (TPR) repeat protein
MNRKEADPTSNFCKRPGARVRRFGGGWWRTGILMVCGAAMSLCGCKMLPRGSSNEQLLASRRMSLQGTDALQRGHWEEAESLFAGAVKKCGVDERAHAGYAEALWQRGAFEPAIREMEKATQLADGNQQLLVRLGEMRFARGDKDGAVNCAQRVLDRDRECCAAWALHGQCLRAQGKIEDALNSYHRALRGQAHSPEVQLAVAEIYCESNRPQRALSTLETLADGYGPGNAPPRVLQLQGVVQTQLKRYEDAVQSLVAAAEKAPSVELLKQLSTAQQLAGDTLGARKTVAEALRLAPNDDGLRQQLAQLESGTPRMASMSGDRMPN